MPIATDPSTGEAEVQVALARYSQSLHKFTTKLWLEARRKAELEAQSDTRPAVLRRKRNPQNRSGEQTSQRPASP